MKKRYAAVILLGLLGVSSLWAQHNQVRTLNYDDFITQVWNFEQYPDSIVVLSTVPVIIDFYADWCHPCRQMAPIMLDLQAEFGDSIQVYKVNVDQERRLAARFHISSIPSFLFVPVSRPAFMVLGQTRKSEMESMIKKRLLTPKK